jgi:hypothetical protein
LALLQRTTTCAFALAVGLLASGCSSSARECNVGADCASGACNLDGTCAPVTDAGADHHVDAGQDAPPPGDTGSQEEAAPPDGSCIASDGGTILRSQIVLLPGLHATFRIAENATVSTAGETKSDGSRTWDLSGALPGDMDVLVETLSPSGAWYAGSFPTAGYVSQLLESSPLLGVFQATESALLLQGVVSPDGGLTQTKLTYKPAVTTLQFPLKQGGTWSTSATVSGKADGVYGAYFEDYTTTVDAHGTMKTPLATFSVQRVGTVLVRTVGVVKTTIRSYVWVTDCYGAVAAMTSKDDEQNAEFTTAAEVRRIAP